MKEIEELPPGALPFMMSYAQQAEDVILRRGLIGVEQGFYIDVGAGHPDKHSVTKHFYNKGWRGINIEPQPDLHRLLEERRERDINLQVAVAPSVGKTVLTLYPDAWGLATTDTAVQHLHERRGLTAKSIEVATRPLSDILEEYAPERIHFLKIDIEGNERVALESIDLSKWRPDIIAVEATIPCSPQEEHEWEGIILEAGYKLGLFDGLNRYYAHDDEAVKRISVPANVFDNYIPYDYWSLMREEEQLRLKEKHGLDDEFPIGSSV